VESQYASQLNEANIIIITGYLILALSMFVGSWVGEVLFKRLRSAATHDLIALLFAILWYTSFLLLFFVYGEHIRVFFYRARLVSMDTAPSSHFHRISTWSLVYFKRF